MAVKERLIDFLNYKGISKSEFGRIIGVSSAFVTSMRKSIQPDKVESIANSFPDLNINWLMTGEGEMLKATKGSGSSDSSADLSSLKQTIQTQSVAINALNKAIELQESELKRKDIALTNKEEEILKLKAEIQRLQRANQELEAK